MVALLPAQPLAIPRRAAFIFSLIPFVLSLLMLAAFEPGVGTLQLTEKVAWIPRLGVYYSLGVDGFSLWLILLTTLPHAGDHPRRLGRHRALLQGVHDASCWCSRAACSARWWRSTCSSSSSSGS